MDPLNSYCPIPFNIVLFFFLFCFNSAEAAWLPQDPYLSYPPSALEQPSVPFSKPTPPLAIPTLAPPSSNHKPRLRKISPSSPEQPAASPRPQNSALTTNSPSPSSWSSFFASPFSGSPKTNPHGNRFMQSLQPNEASSESSPSSASVDSAIQQLCNQTDYPDLCVSSVRPFLEVGGIPVIDCITMLKMVTKACSIQTEQALATASKLSTEQKSADRTAMAIMDCKEMYSQTLDGLQKAMDAISDKDIGTFNSMLSAVISDAETCEDGFNGQKSPLSDFDDKLRKMGSNCLAIACLIKW